MEHFRILTPPHSVASGRAGRPRSGSHSGIFFRGGGGMARFGREKGLASRRRGQGTNSGQATESGNQFSISDSPTILSPQPPSAARFGLGGRDFLRVFVVLCETCLLSPSWKGITQSHKATKPQSHKGTKTQRHKGTKAQRHKGTKAQRHKGTKGQNRIRGFSAVRASASRARMKWRLVLLAKVAGKRSRGTESATGSAGNDFRLESKLLYFGVQPPGNRISSHSSNSFHSWFPSPCGG